jgi:hypothetical protein
VNAIAGIQFDQSLAVAWSQADSFSDVTIYASLTGNFFQTPIQVYLTDQIGPGTTQAANEIASTQFSPPFSSTAVEYPLFSGLTLAPGPYYLVLANSSTPQGWAHTASPTITTAPGVAGPSNFIVAVSDPYPPANNTAGAVPFLFRVTGTEVVPEPASLVTLLIGAALVGLLVRR